jgi:hypothetical protein
VKQKSGTTAVKQDMKMEFEQETGRRVSLQVAVVYRKQT